MDNNLLVQVEQAQVHVNGVQGHNTKGVRTEIVVHGKIHVLMDNILLVQVIQPRVIVIGVINMQNIKILVKIDLVVNLRHIKSTLTKDILMEIGMDLII